MRAVAFVFAALLIASQAAYAGYEDAMAAYLAGNYAGAGESFRAMVEESPSYDFGHYMLGVCLAQQNRNEEAIDRLGIALELNGDRFEYHHALAQAHLQADQPAEALDALEGVEQLVGVANLYHFHSGRGLAYASLKEWEAAARELELADGALPGQKKVINRLALSYFKLKRYLDAVPALRRSLKIDPGAAPHHRMLAEALMRIEPDKAQKEEAFEAATAYREMNPQDAGAAELLGRAALAAGRTEQAISSFSFVLVGDPGDCVARINLSLALLASKRADLAEETLTAAKHCDAEQPLLLETLGMVHRIQGRYEEALATYELAYEMQPTASVQKALEEVNHNIEVLKHNEAVEEQQRLDREDEAMLDKIEQWTRFTQDHPAGLE
jgi:tetratricopeptide (TPR) repeat protein